jgi:hypothetical protein
MPRFIRKFLEVLRLEHSRHLSTRSKQKILQKANNVFQSLCTTLTTSDSGRVADSQKALELALQSRFKASILNDLSPGQEDSEEEQLIPVLETTCTLLDRLIEDQQNAQSLPLSDSSRRDSEPHSITTELPKTFSSELEPELSATAEEIIKVCDWLLVAKDDTNTSCPEVLQVLSDKLANVLEKEGVRVINDTGPFNHERHQVVETQVTDEPSLNEMVCATVRPGYLFHDRLVRPQEVVIYTWEDRQGQC